MAVPIPPSAPAVPPSPRQPTAASSSKIPRRRTSSSLGGDALPSPAPNANDGVPARAPTSPEKTTFSSTSGSNTGTGTGRGTHSRRSSRTGFLPPAAADPSPPPPSEARSSVAPSSEPLIERRRKSNTAQHADPASSNSSDNPAARPDMKRTPSLSIYIPPTPSSGSGSTVSAPPERLRAAAVGIGIGVELPNRPPRRMGHSRTASRESAASILPSANEYGSATTTTSPQRTRQYPFGSVPGSGSTRRCSAPVTTGTGTGNASSTSPFARPPRTPYPFPSARGGGGGGAPLRPAILERTLSDSTMATYTSFDLQHPRTPDEEREANRLSLLALDKRRRWRGFALGGWLFGGGRGGGGREGQDEEARDLEAGAGEGGDLLTRPPGATTGKDRKQLGQGKQGGEPARSADAAVDERTALLGSMTARNQDDRSPRGATTDDAHADSLGVTREQGKWEYVRGEVKCYAKHMLPPIFVFVVLVLGIALLAYRQGIHRITHPPKQ
ncbi:hypothetical protein JCM10908_001449 [Rhodotorula pacifica]|uniref:uncharacterized protein n=1 Tax=Rhodotorula pacifica TaxID=1495444 RepID=UPI0031822B1C